MTAGTLLIICVFRMIRSLAFAAQNFGMTPPGVYRSGLQGSELLDGTVFIRVSILLSSSVSIMRADWSLHPDIHSSPGFF